jgi:hypothetical protein
MSTDYESQIDELVDQADDLEDSLPKLAILEEAVRIADAHQDVDLGFIIRKDLVRTATFCGCAEKSLVHFSWRLAQCDRDPERYDEMGLLWEYKWVANALPRFPQITQRQMVEMLDDMEERYRRLGVGLRPIHHQRRVIAMEAGEVEEAKKELQLWQKTPGDIKDDCAACVQNQLVEYFLFVGEPERAMTAAVPILAGKLRCAEIPHATLSLVVLPLLRMGRPDEAMAQHRKGYQLVSGNREFLDEVSRHLTFLVVTDNLDRAVKLLEKHLPWALDVLALSRQFTFFLASLLLTERLIDVGTTSLHLRLPRTFDAYQESGTYDVAVLAAWFDEACRELAVRFNERNGNDYFTRRIAETRKLKEQITPFRYKQPGGKEE